MDRRSTYRGVRLEQRPQLPLERAVFVQRAACPCIVYHISHIPLWARQSRYFGSLCFMCLAPSFLLSAVRHADP